MIAPMNFDKNGRRYLNKNSAHIDNLLADYLEKHEIAVSSNNAFVRKWEKMQRKYGSLNDESTGLHTAAFKPALTETLTALFNANPKLDAIIFTDIITSSVQYNDSTARMAQWHGVSRKLKVQGLGNGVNENFNWAQSVDGISLASYVFNRKQQLLLHSVGGIQIAQALELQNNRAKFKRRKDLLRNDKEINEAIALAMHPLIAMKNYPLATQ